MGRIGTAQWKGDLEGGSGTLSTGTGALSDEPYTYKSRFADGSATNPEELLGAAHAGCFTMALSLVLGQGGNAPEQLDTTADVTLKMVDQKPTITKIALKVEGRVPGIDQAAFEEAAEGAKAGCVVSRALSGVEDITLEATLVS